MNESLNQPCPKNDKASDGYWVIQAKFKTINSLKEQFDLEWVARNLTKELDNYRTRKVKVKKPDNYLFFTNI